MSGSKTHQNTHFTYTTCLQHTDRHTYTDTHNHTCQDVHRNTIPTKHTHSINTTQTQALDTQTHTDTYKNATLHIQAQTKLTPHIYTHMQIHRHLTQTTHTLTHT